MLNQKTAHERKGCGFFEHLGAGWIAAATDGLFFIELDAATSHHGFTQAGPGTEQPRFGGGQRQSLFIGIVLNGLVGQITGADDTLVTGGQEVKDWFDAVEQVVQWFVRWCFFGNSRLEIIG